MHEPSHPNLRFLFGAFLAVAATFAAAGAYDEYALTRIDSASDAIAYGAAPSIQHLAAVRAVVRHVEFLLDRDTRDADLATRRETEQALALLNQEARAYLALPTFPGEKDLWQDLEQAIEGFDRVSHRVLAQADAGALGAARASLGEVPAAANRVLDATSRSIELNAAAGRELALGIKAVHRRATWIAWILTALCVALAVVAGLLVRAQVRRYGTLTSEHAALQELRARELETFAGRAAHDILNPVAATQMALDLAARRPLPDARARELIERAARNLRRVRTIVDGLLQFARSGARPAAGEATPVADVLEDVVAGARATAEPAGIDLSVEPLPSCVAACSPGVLTSMASNLLQNAIAHMGARDPRRVGLRALDRGDLVRVEVEDTGPGIPPDALDRIFQPYVRGPGAGKGGLGLGLATVRRLSEAHGGRAGVRSVLGEGSVFWFELPKAAARPGAARADRSRSGPTG